jgi:hypothetical protein
MHFLLGHYSLKNKFALLPSSAALTDQRKSFLFRFGFNIPNFESRIQYPLMALCSQTGK